MKIAIGADHGGYEMKERMKKYITEELGHECVDVGTFSTKRCDYPDYAFMVAEAVSSKKSAGSEGCSRQRDILGKEQ